MGLPVMRPLISVITVVRNGASCIEQTLRSVLDQGLDGLEYIVIDGGSMDGTVDIIRGYKGRLAYWTSEADAGIYDAMNKGIRRASGGALLFLNAGDHLVGRVLTPSLKAPCFLRVRYRHPLGGERPVRLRSYRAGIPNCHQGVVFQNSGLLYDTRYTLAGDYDFYLRHGYTTLGFHDSEGHVYYDNAGLSARNSATRDREITDIIGRNFGAPRAAAFAVKAALRRTAKGLLVRKWS
jgi:putative colanic acid biosynthesis glycosyltransferase